MRCPHCKGLGGGYETCYGYYPELTYEYVEIGDCNHCEGTGVVHFEFDDLNKLEFEREYLCTWFEPDPKYELAFKKWLEYYYKTELYDRRVCSGVDIRTGDATLTNTVEYLDSNRNARRLMNEIVLELRDKEIDNQTWEQARDAALKYSHKEIEQLVIAYEKS